MENENVKCACQGATLTRFVQPIILFLLAESPDHGYELVQKISHTALWQDTTPDATGVYRVLRDMEQRGLISSSVSADSKAGMGSVCLPSRMRPCLHGQLGGNAGTLSQRHRSGECSSA